MAARRALFPEADLCRMAKVAREEGVNIRGYRSADGAYAVVISAGNASAGQGGDDLDERLAQFGAQ